MIATDTHQHALRKFKRSQPEQHATIKLFYTSILIHSDADGPFAQGARGEVEAVKGDAITLLHVTFLKFVTATERTVPIDLRNLFVISMQEHLEGAFRASGRVISTTVTPFILGHACDPCASGVGEIIEPII